MNDDIRQHVLIIGGGLGGLFTGALLAKEGRRVTVLEKNRTIGGGLQTFRRHGVTFETGMHILGGMRSGGSIYKICNYLGILPKIELRDVDHDCMDRITCLSDGRSYNIPEGREAFTAYFQSEFPEESDGIKVYVDAMYELVDEIDFFYLRTDRAPFFMHDEKFFWPADKLVNHYVKGARLRSVLSYMNPLTGGYEGHTPAFIHALINVLYINGASRFAGSSQQVADALADIILQSGGRIIAGDPVTKIDVEEHAIRCVHTLHGQTYTADRFVADIHPAMLLKLTDGKGFTPAFRQRIEKAPNSYSSFCVYIIFKPQAFPFLNHIGYCLSDYESVWHLDRYDSAQWPNGFIYMTPCEREQGTYATKMILNSIMPFEACRPWEDTLTGHRGADYNTWKQQHIDRLLDRMEQLFPGFRSKIDCALGSSPLTIRDYYDEPEGALYGLHKDCHDMAQGQLAVYTKIRNLFMTGQNVSVHGFCGVPLTAIKTAEALVGNNVIANKINAYNSSL